MLTEEIKESVKKISCAFFRHWWNSPGNNTEQGFDAWIKTTNGEKHLSELLALQGEEIPNKGKVLDDLKQYIVNALYAAYDFYDYPNLDEWVGSQIEGIDQFFKSQGEERRLTDEMIEDFAKQPPIEGSYYHAKIKAAKWARDFYESKTTLTDVDLREIDDSIIK